MNCSWRSADDYESAKYPSVRFRVSRMSMGRRIELTRRVRDLMQKMEFASAGGTPQDHVDAALLAGEIDRVYWEFGLEAIDGLEINGEAATAAMQFERGPEDLSREILERIKQNCQMTDDERKN